MFQKDIKVITSKEAKRQINCLGWPLSIYFLILCALNYLYTKQDIITEYLGSIDIDILFFILLIIISITFTFILLVLSRNKLHMYIGQYLIRPNVTTSKKVAYVCIGIGIMLLTLSLSTMFYFFFHTSSIEYTFVGSFRTSKEIIKNILYILFFVFIKPITDEIIFRALIQRELGHFGRYFGVLASAMLYAIMQGNLVNVIPAFFLGWYYSLLTLRHHSIFPSISVACSIALFEYIINIIPDTMIIITISLIVIVYVICAFSIFRKRVNTNMVRYGATEGMLWKVYLTSPSIICCLLLFILNTIFYSFG